MRKNQIKSLRPNIPTIVTDDLKTDLEKFHHQVLRPVLKFQNELILEAFGAEMQRFKIDFSTLAADEKRTKIESTFQKNQKFQMFLLGMTTGLFTEEEFRFYLENQRGLKKRILEMLEERVRSQMVKG